MAEPRSPWFYVLGGCAVLIVVSGLAIVAVAVFGWQKAKELKQTLHDPVKRTAAALEVLEAENLPDGWRSVFAASVPLLGEIAILTAGDTIATAEGLEFGDRGFVYFQMIGSKADDIRRRFEQGDDLGDAFRDAKLRFDMDRELARGSFDVDGGILMWLSGTGRAVVHGASVEGLTTVGAVDCEDDRRSRVLFWWAPLPSDLDAPGALTGTFADGDRLGEFVGHFALCPG